MNLPPEGLRVLMLANTLPPFDLSGAGEQVVQLAHGLEERGHRVELMGRGGAGVPGGKLMFPLRAVLPVLRWLKADQGPCVVQVHESDGGLVVPAVRLWRRLRRRPEVRIVALQQVTYREEFRAVRPLRTTTGEVVGRPARPELVFRWLRAPVHWVLGWLTARLADRVLVPSEQTGLEVRRDYLAREVTVVPNVRAPMRKVEPGKALNGTVPDPSSIAEGRPFFLFVGRLRIRKGVEFLLRALQDAPEARLLVVGDGERSGSIASDVVRLGLQEQVELLGRRGADEIHQLLKRCRALVVPSTYEGMPLVILEAMECGAPVIASRVSGIPEVVVDDETGWLFEVGDVGQLTELLDRAGHHPVRCREMGEAGRVRLNHRYRPEHAVDCWLTALDPP